MTTTPAPVRIPGAGGRFIRMPLCYQQTPYTCGVACVQSLLACWGTIYRQDVLAEKLGTRPVVGTDYHSILEFMRGQGFQAAFVESMGIEGIKNSIDRGATPMLLIQAWEGKPVDYELIWNDAHYVLACGYEDNTFYFMDPYTLGNYTYLPACELLRRWHVKDSSGRRYYGAALLITKASPRVYDPHAVKHLG